MPRMGKNMKERLNFSSLVVACMSFSSFNIFHIWKRAKKKRVDREAQAEQA